MNDGDAQDEGWIEDEFSEAVLSPNPDDHQLRARVNEQWIALSSGQPDDADNAVLLWDIPEPRPASEIAVVCTAEPQLGDPGTVMDSSADTRDVDDVEHVNMVPPLVLRDGSGLTVPVRDASGRARAPLGLTATITARGDRLYECESGFIALSSGMSTVFEIAGHRIPMQQITVSKKGNPARTGRSVIRVNGSICSTEVYITEATKGFWIRIRVVRKRRKSVQEKRESEAATLTSAADAGNSRIEPSVEKTACAQGETDDKASPEPHVNSQVGSGRTVERKSRNLVTIALVILLVVLLAIASTSIA